MSPTSLGIALNPSARISIHASEQPPSFLVEAPVKGAALSRVTVSAENLPGAHAFLCSILIDGRNDAQIGEQEAIELRQIGLFVPADAMPEEVAYRFPRRDLKISNAKNSRDKIGDPARRTAHLSTLRIPAEWQEQALRFEPHHHGSVWAPIQFAGDTELAGCDDKKCVETLNSKGDLDDEKTRIHFEREGFSHLENLLPAEHVKELGRYFKALASQGFLACKEDRGIHRFVAHNHPVARFWHDQLNERVSQLVGQPTKPSYCFVSIYIAGGDLFWHTDRPPCEYTITLLLDCTPLDAEGRSPWALKLKDRNGTIRSLHQRVGEALILRGRELMHSRDPLPDGYSSASLLFHFVNDSYDGELE
ncbi:MAG TPA: hypothetical protein VFN25_12885 [Dokdonella sp.]|uniref:hypothetical protein n=1 Tax=Dokdonella sp. TaxID=2291710 RepID=UPI002D7F481B|nr:hypothetical protein [Dokdonella sp.]HET9033785.1 hypothetical protein [Dokdonella sp.]